MAYTKINAGAGWAETTQLLAAHFAHMEDGIVGVDSDKVAKAGDAMTGPLTIEGAAAVRVVFGSYTGSGSGSKKISLPFAPRDVRITGAFATSWSSLADSGIGTYRATDSSLVRSSSNQFVPTRQADGFTVGGVTSVAHLNNLNEVYRYIAFG